MNQEKNDDIDLSRLIARILRRKVLAISVFFIIFAAAFIYTKVADRFYTTSTRFVYQSSSKSAGNLGALAALAGISIGESSEDGSAYMEDIIKSMDFLSQFINKEWLVSDTLKNADTLLPITLEKFWRIKLDSTANNRDVILQSMLVGKMLKDKYLTYEQDKKTNIISLITSFEDPKLSYEFNIAIFEELNNTLLHKMRSKASENRKFIEDRLVEVKNDLKKSEGALLNYQQQNRAWADPAIQLQEARLTRDVTINQELALQLQKQYEIAKIEESKDMPLLDVIEKPRRALGPSKPQSNKILAIGFVGGIIFGLAFALGFDLFLTEKKVMFAQIEKAKKELG